MKNNISKMLLGIISLATATSAISMQNPYQGRGLHGRGQYPGRGPAVTGQAAQGIQMGNLIIRNTLNEPVQWNVSMRLNGVIPGMGTISNSSASMSGSVPANSQAPLSSGFFMGENTWGNPINLTLRRASGGADLRTQLQQLGTYVLRLDDRGNLVFERQN